MRLLGEWQEQQGISQSPVSCWNMGIQSAVISSGTYLREKIVLQGFFTYSQGHHFIDHLPPNLLGDQSYTRAVTACPAAIGWNSCCRWMG